ncbi:hypothetical protein MUN78_04840 [Leucobacter allii]|uniref:Membrane protein YczE n=1 Tax=Leucobacter allii TaxID=2932247 RepID=A0ABY4FPK9_9MICO|nr:hypothetical protein [Leucobacter allii]UOQ58176.1 hypothetical protein MUN78_04840 [Leucobacter allii]
MLGRLARLIPGLLLYGIADAFMIRAAIGVDPWTVFAQGLSLRTGLGIGLLTNLIGLAVLLLWWPLRQRPGMGTVLNILLVGPGIELGLWLLPVPETLWLRCLFFAIGLLLLAVASGIYIGAHLGPGPRDGLMTGLHHRFGTPIWIGRTAIEATVLAVGWLLGGNVGIGTVVFALCIGPLCAVALPFFDRDRRRGGASSAGAAGSAGAAADPADAREPRDPSGDPAARPAPTA